MRKEVYLVPRELEVGDELIFPVKGTIKEIIAGVAYQDAGHNAGYRLDFEGFSAALHRNAVVRVLRDVPMTDTEKLAHVRTELKDAQLRATCYEDYESRLYDLLTFLDNNA